MTKKVSMILFSLLLITSMMLPVAGAQTSSLMQEDALVTRQAAAVTALELFESLGGKIESVGSNPFTDVNDPALTKAYYAGIVAGVGDGKFNPNAAISRQEAAVMLHNVLKSLEDNKFKSSGSAQFADANQIASWAKASVSYLNEAGVMKAEAQNNMNPRERLTYGELSILFDNANSFMAPALCKKLEGMSISASQIGLPTTGATVKSADLVSAMEEGNVNGEYCKVLGAIHPIDPNAPDINFQVNLPTNWNQKVLHYGGGGFNGTVETATGPSAGQPFASPSALALGYVTFGSDSGHEGIGWDGSFGLNDEALQNFAADQLKKTRDTALALVEARYNSKPSHIYFAGGSEGGREALIIVQRFPQDYDGVISVYPVLNWVAKALADNRNANILHANNGEGWISPEKNRLINETVKEICDSLDGLADGIISNIKACAEKEEEIYTKLACPAGVTESSTCLPSPQMKSLKAFASSMDFSFPLADGLTSMPGYAVLQGAPLQDQYFNQFGQSPTVRDGIMAQFADAVIQYKVVRDKDFNPVDFNPDLYKEQVVKASELLNATNPDISKFKQIGGKLILVHGTTDQIVTVYGSIAYYEQLVSKFGQNELDSFVKFYLVPGYGHYLGTDFHAGMDLLGALDAWVTRDEAPANLTAVDQNVDTAGRTRPLCEYPTYPKYKGSGDVNDASSFICAAP